MNNYKENDRSFYKIIFVNFIYFLLLTQTFIFNQHFSTDDYYTFFDQQGIAKDVIVKSFRLPLGIGYYILSLLNINVVRYQVFFGFLMIIIFSICIAVISNLLIKERKDVNIYLFNAGSSILIGNVFLSEWLNFALAYLQWTFAVLFMTLALFFFCKDYNRKKNLVLSDFFLILAIGNYQMIVCCFVTVVLGYIMLMEENKIMNIVRNVIVLFLNVAISVVLSITLTKVVCNITGIGSEQGRINMSWAGSIDVIKAYVKQIKLVWIDGLYITPRYFISFCFLIICLFFILEMFNREKIKNAFYKIFLMFSCVIILHLIILSSQITQGFCWLSVRVMLPIFGCFSLIIWQLAINVNEWLKKVYIVGIALFLLINIYLTQVQGTNLIKTNSIDKVYFKSVAEKIERYEENTGNKIRNVGIIKDSYCEYKYSDYLRYVPYSELQERALVREWSDITALRYYTGYDLQRIDVPQEVVKRIEGIDWRFINLEEQIIFEGQNMYLIVF